MPNADTLAACRGRTSTPRSSFWSHARWLHELDDTLWPTGEVVFHANELLNGYLRESYPAIPISKGFEVQEQMKEIRRTAEEADPDFQVHYGKLRRAGIRQLAMKYYSDEEAETCAQEGFRIWLQERQDAAGRLLFSDAVSTLRALRGQGGVLIGAITNGNGDPRDIAPLRPYFDFVVSAEEPDVKHPKPHPRAFEVAMDRAAALAESSTEWMAAGVGRENVAYAWLHVGDCIDNDVRAASVTP